MCEAKSLHDIERAAKRWLKEQFTSSYRSWAVSVCIVTRPRAGRPGYVSQQEWRRNFFFATGYLPALKSTQPPL